MEFIAFVLILGSILWLINRKSNLTKTTPVNKIPDRARKEAIALSKDPSQRKPYDPDWVLRHLLQVHPQFFSQNNIKIVLADCAPHDKEVYEPVFSFTWVWIVELLKSPINKEDCRFAYIVGWFDPRLWEPVSHLQAWFFSSKEEALACAITSLEIGKGKTKPNNKLYDFLKHQIKQGKKVLRNPHNHWKSVSDWVPGD